MKGWMVGAWLVASLMVGTADAEDAALRLGVFDVDASPPVGSPLAYDINDGVQVPLSCRGVVLIGAGDPIVLCAVDWIGIANQGHARFCEELAEAVGTPVERVAVHTLHQHDAPVCDFSTAQLLAPYGLAQNFFDSGFARKVMARAAAAARQAAQDAQPVTHLGIGQARVEKVASNRRILGPDGKVAHMRWTATADPAIRAMPVGTIDPILTIVSFWNGDQPLAALSYFATHPQSYYRTGLANPDFPGLARNARQQATGVPHIHFNGAGGNIGAGKWNDGSVENRQILADRMAEGMRKAWEATSRAPLGADQVAWQVLPVTLPVSRHLDARQLRAELEDTQRDPRQRLLAATKLAWLTRCQAGERLDVACLRLGEVRILHMPGELFVEYQLAAQKMAPDAVVAMAAYGDYAPGYIGTEVAYTEGGYETGPDASLVAPEVEQVLMEAMRDLLADPRPH